MPKSISVLRKKRGRPATGTDPLLNFRSPPELTHALDAWIASQPEPRPSRSEAIRYALRDWLIGLGLLKHREDPEGAN
jgi:Arc/MetJ-type ribon-helix-helix transcriptional regulator